MLSNGFIRARWRSGSRPVPDCIPQLLPLTFLKQLTPTRQERVHGGLATATARGTTENTGSKEVNAPRKLSLILTRAIKTDEGEIYRGGECGRNARGDAAAESGVTVASEGGDRETFNEV